MNLGSWGSGEDLRGIGRINHKLNIFYQNNLFSILEIKIKNLTMSQPQRRPSKSESLGQPMGPNFYKAVRGTNAPKERMTTLWKEFHRCLPLLWMEQPHTSHLPLSITVFHTALSITAADPPADCVPGRSLVDSRLTPWWSCSSLVCILNVFLGNHKLKPFSLGALLLVVSIFIENQLKVLYIFSIYRFPLLVWCSSLVHINPLCSYLQINAVAL